MKEGDIVLTPIPQADGVIKNRPAIVLREMPPYRDFLLLRVLENDQAFSKRINTRTILRFASLYVFEDGNLLELPPEVSANVGDYEIDWYFPVGIGGIGNH